MKSRECPPSPKARSVAARAHPVRFEADILMQFREGAQDRKLVVDVTRLRNRSTFFLKLKGRIAQVGVYSTLKADFLAN